VQAANTTYLSGGLSESEAIHTKNIRMNWWVALMAVMHPLHTSLAGTGSIIDVRTPPGQLLCSHH
jgi:hypothetical protein